MASKFDGDVRPLSNDPRYMGVVFDSSITGTIDEAIEQAHLMDDHGLAEQPGRPAHISRDRWNLLEHLNLTRRYAADPEVDAIVDAAFADFERKPPQRAASPYSLEYAMSRWPENFGPREPVLPPNWGLPS